MRKIIEHNTRTTVLALAVGWAGFACLGPDEHSKSDLIDERAELDDEVGLLTDEDIGRSSWGLTKGTVGAANGDLDFCNDPANPCLAGEGDCDRNADCGPGLVCSGNVGLNYGFSAGVDVCEPDLNGTAGYCTVAEPCGDGEGDCNFTGQCLPGHTCVGNIGAQYGFTPGIDVCVFTAPGSPDYCTVADPCGEGEGDCDFDAQCQAGLECVGNVGANYGFTPGVDVCETSTVAGP